MFSSITIASSTTKPIERISAIIEMLLSVKPSSYITVNVPSDRKRQRHRRDQRRRSRCAGTGRSRDDQRQRDEHGELDVAERFADVPGDRRGPPGAPTAAARR